MLNKSIAALFTVSFFLHAFSLTVDGETATPASAVQAPAPENKAAYIPIDVNGTTYFYSGGSFYQKTLDGYVLVAPPQGAVVPTLPEKAMMVKVKGKTYYYYNNVYYTANGGAYMVTNDPTKSPAPSAVQATPASTQPAASVPVAAGTVTTVTTMPGQVIVTQPPPPVIVVKRNPDSQNPIKKLGRGVFNAAFGFLEIFINMGDIAQKEGPPQALTYGFFKGIGFFILRETVGVLEIGTFPIPLPFTVENGVRDWGYGPLMEPEWILK